MTPSFPSDREAGLGLRREFLHEVLELPVAQRPAFFEIAPENWIRASTRERKILEKIRQDTPLVLHGLSLSIGGVQPINFELLTQVKQLMQEYEIAWYSEHLSFSDDSTGYLYDLLPMPMTPAAIVHVCERIDQVQNFMGKPLILENASTYLFPYAEMSEIEFVHEIVRQSGCELLLDVNNVYVNSINHNQDAMTFIRSIPNEKVRYYHMAGHHVVRPDLLVDTHGNTICNDVWQLFENTLACLGPKPSLLERDFEIPPLQELLEEYRQLANYLAMTPDPALANVSMTASTVDQSL